MRISTLYFQDANGPSAEAILCFSDGVLLFILPILVLVLLFILSYLFSELSYRAFKECQLVEFF